ncbi:TetR/AcrR family transcriptional regulator [Acidiferrimicrobium sp. IK]|uniref:TetR/AcrR family transcriptional regulator n=1 Tax=Acidiferrimicrobium sp. IK TaxID=2871700 RepID=UPI0021CB0B86|nr:TetR/AcrR family transcriptional regulator [Acidiferrimicrobium sp. IK]MCU4187488.1 TetR/AcrR family transcriptional regulator [Acidiferrimicrobium sp. IK]
MAQLRWGSDAPTDVDAARERLLVAAEAAFRRYGVLKTTVEDVATLAKVSRATVYRYFAGRDELILGVLLREGDRFIKRLSARLDVAANLEDALLTGVVYTLQAIRRDKNLALLFAPETAGLTTTIAGASEALFSLMTGFIRPYLENGTTNAPFPEGIDASDAAEWLLRAVLSFATVEGPRKRTEQQLRDYLRCFLIPALVGPPAAVRVRPS